MNLFKFKSYASIKQWYYSRFKSIHRKRIVVITDNPESIKKQTYLVRYLIPFWKERGFNITIVTAEESVDADIAILHVDATQVPILYAEVCQQYPVVLNGNFLDNSKSIVSRHLVKKEDNFFAPVIIKTDANYGGLPEIRSKDSNSIDLIVKDTQDIDMIDWAKVQAIHPDQYLVLQSADLVPNAVWSNPNLIVEKFLPERTAEGLYCLRACLFFGDQEINIIAFSKSPVVKGSNVISQKILKTETPTELQKLRKELNIDFGRLDYVIADGNVVLYDANKTATLSHQTSVDWAEQVTLPLSFGIEAFFEE